VSKFENTCDSCNSFPVDHCSAHEDHEMMRIYHVGPLPEDQMGGSCPSDEDIAQDPETQETNADDPQEKDDAFSLKTIFSFAVAIFCSQLI
jgi:hypothetical protein